MTFLKRLRIYGLAIFGGLLILVGISDPVAGQSSEPIMTSESISPIYMHNSTDNENNLSPRISARYALLSAGHIKRAAFYLNEKPKKLAHQVMWFYRQEDLKNMAGLESVGDLSARLNNMMLSEPKTRAFPKRNQRFQPVGCDRP